jgi:hypothetical protein
MCEFLSFFFYFQSKPFPLKPSNNAQQVDHHHTQHYPGPTLLQRKF